MILKKIRKYPHRGCHKLSGQILNQYANSVDRWIQRLHVATETVWILWIRDFLFVQKYLASIGAVFFHILLQIFEKCPNDFFFYVALTAYFFVAKKQGVSC